MRPVLGYWDLRGRGEYIRLLLTYLGLDYEDKRYKIGRAPTYDRAQWISDKASLPLDFPNLPYWIDDDVKLSQSHAILHYLGRKYDLNGRDNAEQTRIELIEEEALDLHTAIAGVAYADFKNPSPTPQFPKLKEALIKSLPERLTKFEKFIGDGPWVVGDRLTTGDFRLYCSLDIITVLDKSLFEAYPNIRAFLSRFEELPKVADHINSPAYKRSATFAPFASFGR